MAKRPIVVDTTIDSPLAAFGVNLAKDVPIPKALAPGLFVRHVRRRNELRKRWVGYVKPQAACIRRKGVRGLTTRLASTVFFVCFVVQIFIVIGLWARPAPGNPWLKILYSKVLRWFWWASKTRPHPTVHSTFQFGSSIVAQTVR